MTDKRIKWLLIAIFAFEIIYWGIQVLTKGKWIDTYFVTDLHNTGMDYFNMLANIFYVDPYSFNSNYPALCFIIWRVLFRIMPWNENCGNGFYLREYMPAQLGYIIFLLSVIILILEVTKKIFGNEYKNGLMLSLCVIFSGPILFTIERGNIIILAFAMLLVFSHSLTLKKKWQRYVAYLALAISAAIKIYPALFGIFIIYKKRYKEALVTFLIGFLTFVLPFFCFKGIDSIKTMIHGIMVTSSESVSLGSNFNFSIANLNIIINKALHIQIPNFICICGALVLCILLYIFGDKLWKKILAITLLCIWLPAFSYTYTLIFLIIPFIFFVKDHREEKAFYLYALSYFAILIPMALPTVQGFDESSAKFPLGYPTLIINAVIVLLCVVSLIEGIIVKNKEYNHEN